VLGIFVVIYAMKLQRGDLGKAVIFFSHSILIRELMIFLVQNTKAVNDMP
jgi:hypothetical protein